MTKGYLNALRKIKVLPLVFTTIISFIAQAQEKFSISGTIREKKNGETMIGATVRVKELKNVGASSNEYGFYSLTLPKGEYTLVCNYLGYADFEQKVNLEKSQTIDIKLAENDQSLDEVVVTSEREDRNVTETQVAVTKLEVKEIAKIPVLFGEKDILKTIQLLPGIKGSGEGQSGFNVRGGSADQNLILLDEATVYNASHLLGFFSTFNSDAIKDVSVYKGAMPAQYGGRLSSVLDIKMKEGNNQNYNVSGGIGLISSRLNVEGPIQKDKGSFMVAGRRSYADLFLKLSNDENTRSSSLYFYDLNAKLNYTLGKKDRLFISGYFGRDKLGFGSNFGIDWGNTTGTLRWNHIYNDKLFSNTSLIYSNYNYKISINSGANDFDITSVIKDWNLKHEFQYFSNDRNTMRFGVNFVHHTITPGQISASGSSSLNSKPLEDRYGLENAAFFSNEWKASTRLSFIYGLRLSSFSSVGKGTFYTYDAEGNVNGSSTYNSGEIVKTYINPEPRLSANLILNSNSSIKGGYARNIQYLHLISNSTSATPTDSWIPTSGNVKPEISDQVSIGYYRNFANNKYEFSAETYYKDMQNQIDYKDGANSQANEKIEGELLFGKGRAYGLELFVKKKYGKLNGWISYTLSRTERSIDGINNGNWYAARQDRTHDISVVAIYNLSERWSLGATWVYYTGNAVTFPSGKYTLDGNTQFLYTERNGYRMPDYHRLDLSATLYSKKTKKFESSWNFSLYNAYGRENAFTITFRESKSDPSKTEAVQTTLFRWVPSVTYNFKF